MSRLSRAVLFVLSSALSLALASPPASAAPNRTLETLLAETWKTVLELPAPENPFTGGDPCVGVGTVVAPFAPIGEDLSCTIKPGTWVFVTGYSSECSTVEAPPYFGEDAASLLECAEDADEGFRTPTISVDGRLVAVTEVTTELMTLDLPADNIFGAPSGTAYSVAHGWVALLHPLPPGSHLVTIHNVGTDAYGAEIDAINHTTIVVQPSLR